MKPADATDSSSPAVQRHLLLKGSQSAEVQGDAAVQAGGEDRPADASRASADSDVIRSRRPARRCNALNGKRWLQNSISVWSDIRKTTEETRLKHPAMFPTMLPERLIETFLPPGGDVVLDPFSGSGSTLVAAERAGKQGVGFEISPEYIALAKSRLAEAAEPGCPPRSVLHPVSCTELSHHLAPQSVDLCITSPPYWDILNQRRSADMKEVRHYGNLDADLGIIQSYEEFLSAVTGVLSGVLTVLKPGAYCCVVVMDLRKKNRFFPLHSDLAERLRQSGYVYDDLVVWNRQSEYNNLRPLGYPSVFRMNKVHEYVLLMQKPRAS